MESNPNESIDSIIFDLGGVLIDWNPYYLYRKIFSTEEEIDHFLATICTPQWNEEQDAGRPLAEGTELLVALYPAHEKEIRAFYGRWTEMLGKPHMDTVSLLRQLKDSGQYHLYALTNWSAETFPVALERFDFLHWFEGTVVSGKEKTRKPFREIFDILIDRFQIQPEKAIFIDDNLRNVEGASALGMKTVAFQNAGQLREDLLKWGVRV